MLESLTLENFQAWANLTVPFGPGVTSIVGPSDVGKSAILRALRWVCLNDMVGTGMMRHGTTSMAVRLTVDGHVVVRSRNSAGNKYALDTAQWAAVKQQLPGAIGSLLQLPAVCFQGQHDSPFWLAANAADVGRAVNSVVDLTVVDRALTFANGAAQRAGVAEQVLTDDVKAQRAKVAALVWVPGAVQAWAGLTAERNRIAALRTQHATLAKVIANTVQMVAAARVARQRAQAAQALHGQLLRLVALSGKRAVLQANIQAAASLNSAKAKGLCATGLLADVAALGSLRVKVAALRQAISSVALRQANVGLWAGRVEAAQAALAKAQAAHAAEVAAAEAAKAQAAAAAQVCVTCGRPL